METEIPHGADDVVGMSRVTVEPTLVDHDPAVGAILSWDPVAYDYLVAIIAARGRRRRQPGNT